MPKMDGLELSPDRSRSTTVRSLVSRPRRRRDGGRRAQGNCIQRLSKPFATDHLIAGARRTRRNAPLVISTTAASAPRRRSSRRAEPLIGETSDGPPPRNNARSLEYDIDVLVEGETGTGRKLILLSLRWLNAAPPVRRRMLPLCITRAVRRRSHHRAGFICGDVPRLPAPAASKPRTATALFHRRDRARCRRSRAKLLGCWARYWSFSAFTSTRALDLRVGQRS